jgi:hypothetical protein
MTEVLVKEQVAAQRAWFASFKLLEQIMEALERLSPQQAGVVLTEGPVVEGTEVVPVVFGNVERVQTPLFLKDSHSTDMPFALEASKDSNEESGMMAAGARTEGVGARTEGVGVRTEGVGARTAITVLLGLWTGMRWLSKWRAIFLFTMPFSSLCSCTSFPPVPIVYFYFGYIIFVCPLFPD